MAIIAALGLAGSLALEGCPSPAVSPPNASDAATQVTVTTTIAASDSGSILFTPCNLACTNMAKLGCPEGVNANCVDVCNHAQASGLTNLKPDCLASAATVAAAKACGTVTCAIDAGVKK